MGKRGSSRGIHRKRKSRKSKNRKRKSSWKEKLEK